MPYVNVKITREGNVNAEKKARLIHEITDLLWRELSKPPNTTFVVIDEVDLDNWGIAGLPVPEFRRQAAIDDKAGG